MSYRSIVVNGLVVIRWNSAELQDLAGMEGEVVETEARLGRKIFLVVVSPSENIFSLELRNALGAGLKRVNGHCAHHVAVIEGGGVNKSFMRAVAMAIAVGSNALGPHGVCSVSSTVREALIGSEPYSLQSVAATMAQLHAAGMLPG